MSTTPLIQCAFPSSTENLTSRTEKNRQMVSTGSNNNVSGLPSPHAINIKSGTTNSAIWIQLPTATDIAKSNFPFLATTTAVTCSAAFERIGRMINVRNSREMAVFSVLNFVKESRRFSEVRYARNVTVTKRRRVDGVFILSWTTGSPIVSQTEPLREGEAAPRLGDIEPVCNIALDEASERWTVSKKR